MKHLFIIVTFFFALAFADKTVVKTVTINQMFYPEKSFTQIKEIALQEAKSAAAKEIYGEFLTSETVMFNGKILNDVVREESSGIVRIKGEPKFRNGEEFGDIVVTIEAYATDEDLQNMAIQREREEFSIGATSDKIAQIKQGFYGTWKGFIIKSGGSSSDVIVKITNSGRTTINYVASNCGGDLIIQQKSSTMIKFRQKLTYGWKRCTDKLFIVLKKVNDTQSLFMQLDEDGREVAKGTLYREE